MNGGFKGLITWQKAYEFALEVYKITKEFPKEERYGLCSQIRRASVSVCGNIAEGYERKHRKEYIHFLYYAKGSLGEVETYLLFVRDLGYQKKSQFETFEYQRKEVAKLLTGLIRSL